MSRCLKYSNFTLKYLTNLFVVYCIENLKTIVQEIQKWHIVIPESIKVG